MSSLLEGAKRLVSRGSELSERVEGLEHAPDGVINEAVGGHRFDVFPVDRRQGRGKDAVLLRNLILGGLGLRRAAEKASGHGA